MDRLYAPWRTKYVRGIHSGKKEDGAEVCPFCEQYAAQKDLYYGILLRAKYHFVMMNAYPYSGGHLLIISNEFCPCEELIFAILATASLDNVGAGPLFLEDFCCL